MEKRRVLSAFREGEKGCFREKGESGLSLFNLGIHNKILKREDWWTVADKKKKKKKKLLFSFYTSV